MTKSCGHREKVLLLSEKDQQAIADATKAIMRRVAKSVWVIACRHEGKRMAMAATSVDAFTMDPPAMLFCINRNASMYPALAKERFFSVNMLGADHEAVSQACSGGLNGEERFSVGLWEDHPETGVPMLSDAQGVMICSKENSLSHGTHELFVGSVIDVRMTAPLHPMVYLSGGYARIPVEA